MYRGVKFDAAKGLWYAQIWVDGAWVRLGHFDDEKDAALEYDRKALELRGRTFNFDANGNVRPQIAERERKRPGSQIGPERLARLRRLNEDIGRLADLRALRTFEGRATSVHGSIAVSPCATPLSALLSAPELQLAAEKGGCVYTGKPEDLERRVFDALRRRRRQRRRNAFGERAYAMLRDRTEDGTGMLHLLKAKRLTIGSGDEAGRAAALASGLTKPDGSSVLLGSAVGGVDCFAGAHSDIRERHAEIAWRDGAWWVTPLADVYVDCALCAAGSPPKRLDARAVLRIGATVFYFLAAIDDGLGGVRASAPPAQRPGDADIEELERQLGAAHARGRLLASDLCLKC